MKVFLNSIPVKAFYWYLPQIRRFFNPISHWSFVAIEIAFNRIRNIREYKVLKTIKGLWNTKKDLNHIRNVREYKVLKFEMLLNLECWTTNIEFWNCNCYWSLTRVRDSGGILFKRRLRNSKSTFKKIQRIARPFCEATKQKGNAQVRQA